MDIADSTRGRTTRHAHGRTLGIFGCVSLIFIYYWALLSDGKFLSAAPVHYGLVFNSMRWPFQNRAMCIVLSVLMKFSSSRKLIRVHAVGCLL